jgi:hypothetical protein
LLAEAVSSLQQTLYRADPRQDLTRSETEALERAGFELSPGDLGGDDPLARSAAQYAALIKTSLSTSRVAAMLGVKANSVTDFDTFPVLRENEDFVVRLEILCHERAVGRDDELDVRKQGADVVDPGKSAAVAVTESIDGNVGACFFKENLPVRSDDPGHADGLEAHTPRGRRVRLHAETDDAVTDQYCFAGSDDCEIRLGHE